MQRHGTRREVGNVSSAEAETLDRTAVLRIAEADSVAVSLADMKAGTEVSVDGQPVTLKNDIPAFHKFALTALSEGDDVYRFGEKIGTASRDISIGEHIHSHNLNSALIGSQAYDLDRQPAQMQGTAPSEAHFMGYRRADGRVGTRNEIWVIPTVGCVARTSEQIASRMREKLNGRADDVIALPHPFGCSQLGDDLADTRTLLASLASHPNVGGLILVALGCESNQADELLKEVSLPSERVKIVRSQMVADEIEDGLTAVEELLEITSKDQRTECGLSDLVIGLKCGGSDALSGLTANPLLGDVTDWVTAGNGKAILTEIPEIFGAEHLLIARSPDRNVRVAIANIVNDFKDYYVRQGHPVNENPSPGNKAGGITTLEEKSLGAVQKAGKAPVRDVIKYARQVTADGLTLLEAPGNDAISCTALAAAGATVILFTTGRGTPLGFPVPTTKVASNSDLAKRKPNWIDFDAGQILKAPSRDQVAEKFFEKIIAVASGERTYSEKNGERAIAIWKRGVTL